MNTADVEPIARYAHRQIDNGMVGCILQAEQVAELTAAVAERDVLVARMAEIDAVALKALVGSACGTCYCEVLREIRELCQTGP